LVERLFVALQTRDCLDWSRAEVVQFPNLKLSTSTISLRLPAQLLADLKRLANKRDVPYQSLLKVYLSERVAAESAKVLVRYGRRVEERRR
jgi:predicted DNA binding CopG/RHH family protein